MDTSLIREKEDKLVLPTIKHKYCLYARKSTEQDEKQSLSIESQVREMTQIAEREGLEIVEIRRESHSAKDSRTRPVFNEILKDIEKDRFNAIITWAPDRLSRNAGDLGSLVDLIDQKKLLQIKTFGQTFTDSPSDKFLLMILCSQAKLENDNKSINVKRGLRARVEMGLWPCRPPTGYLKNNRVDKKCECVIDPERAPVIKKMFEKIAYDKWSGRRVHNWLEHDINFRTYTGKHLSLGNVFQVLSNHFYYGTFEFPKKSEKWYQGKHEPIITKGLFDQTRASMKTHVIKLGYKEFAFTKMIKCGLCNSGITADEKFKKLKNGGVNRHVYYLCTKVRNRNCKNPPINENDLIKEFQKLAEKLELNELKLTKKLNEEIERFKKLQAMFLGKKTTADIENIDLRDYMKFILKDGSILEKRAILECLKSEMTLRDKLIFVKNQKGYTSLIK